MQAGATSARRVYEGEPRSYQVGPAVNISLSRSRGESFFQQGGLNDDALQRSRRKFDLKYLLNSNTQSVWILRGQMHYRYEMKEMNVHVLAGFHYACERVLCFLRRDFYTPTTKGHSGEERSDDSKESDEESIEASLEDYPRSVFEASSGFEDNHRDQNTPADAGTDTQLYPIRDLVLRRLAKHVHENMGDTSLETDNGRIHPLAGREPSDIELMSTAKVHRDYTRAFGFPDAETTPTTIQTDANLLSGEVRSKLAHEMTSDTIIRALGRETLQSVDALLTSTGGSEFVPSIRGTKKDTYNTYFRPILRGFQYMYRSGCWALPDYEATNPGEGLPDELAFKRRLYDAFFESFRVKRKSGSVYQSMMTKYRSGERAKSETHDDSM